MLKRERYDFTKEEVKSIMKGTERDTPEKALEDWAYINFDLRHSCVYYICKTGKTFVEIGEVP